MQVSKCIFVVFIILSPVWGIWDLRYHDGNQWQLMVSNCGHFGHTGYGAGAFWPIGSGHNYIYGAGIDVGAIKPNGDTVVTIGYGPHGGEYEFCPGVAYSNPVEDQWRIYFSTDMVYPYEPISFQDGYAVYNDFDVMQHIPDSFYVLGITVTQRTYVWPVGWATDAIFMKYIIKNDTTYTLNDVYIGIPMDFDIGNEAGAAANDRCGIDVPRRLFYGWQEALEPGTPAWRPGMLGYKLLSPYPMSSFKRFTLQYEPDIDREWYLTMVGYNFQTGIYEPYDTIWPAPDDQRIMMSSGPFANLSPGDSIVIDWVLLASADTIPPCPELRYKADKAQSCFDAGWHDVSVFDPNGGEIISGTYDVAYSAVSATANPLLIDWYLLSENGVDTVAEGQSNTGTYSWNTSLCPDGVLYRLACVAYDTVTFGGDNSDGFFTIDNPGNSPPTIHIIAPVDGDTTSGSYNITWFARDPEFQDSLYVNIYFKSQYDTVFQMIAGNESNDSIYTWQTTPYRNGSGLLVVETNDETFTVAETVGVFLVNQTSAGQLNHLRGLNNCVDLSVILHEPSQITGHTYELRFLDYQCLDTISTDYYYPEYIYELIDSNAGTVVVGNYSLKDSYTYLGFALAINDYSPLIDGFSMASLSLYPYRIAAVNFMFDSVAVVTGNYPEDSITAIYSHAKTWWAYRGSRLRLDWMDHVGGGLTLLVTDLDYGDTIPYIPYSPYSGGVNCDSAFGWCFHRVPALPPVPSETLRATDNIINLCGARLMISRAIAPPQVNDCWIVYPTQYAPPVKGNVYRFTSTGVTEYDDQVVTIRLQVFPVPFKRNLTMSYNLPQRQEVSLTIYDVLGRQVKKLTDGIQNSGHYDVVWNGLDDRKRRAAAGVYFCRLETGGGNTATVKVVMLR